MAELNMLEQWYYEVPVVTRVWTTAAVITSVLVQCQIVTPFQLFYSFTSVWSKRQVCHPPPPSNQSTRIVCGRALHCDV